MPGLEGQPQHADAAPPGGQHAADPLLDLPIVGGQDLRQQRQGEVGAAGRVSQGPEVLGQTGAAEGEAGAQVRLRDVELAVHQEDAHHLAGVRPEGLAEIADLVREGDLEGMEGVGDVLGHLRGPDRGLDEGGIHLGVELAEKRAGVRRIGPDQGDGRLGEVPQRGSFAHELRVDRDGQVWQRRRRRSRGGPGGAPIRWCRAARCSGERRCRAFGCRRRPMADPLGHAPDGVDIELAVLPAGRPDADQGQIGFGDRLVGRGGGRADGPRQ